MKSKILPRIFLLIASGYTFTLMFVYPVLSKAAAPQTDYSAQQQCPLRVLSCIAWWSHDAVGYHPAMFLMFENVSGKDILGEEIPFQSRFTELRDGYVTVARDYKRVPIHNRERFSVLLRAPKSFELPIDSSIWPNIECKAMCRLPYKDSGDPQVYDLFVTHIDRITLTDEDAHAQLIAQAERNPLLNLHETPLRQETAKTPEAPPIKTEIPAVKPAAPAKIPTKLPKRLPKIGDDFYTFEQLFGQAKEFQAGTNGSTDDLTWTHYQASPPLADVYAGSRNASKVDALILTVSSRAIAKESEALSLAKALAGCKKDENIAPFQHSVRYLTVGRSEIMTTGIRDRRIISFRLLDSKDPDNSGENHIAIFVTRLPGDPEAALATYKKRVNFIQF